MLSSSASSCCDYREQPPARQIREIGREYKCYSTLRVWPHNVEEEAMNWVSACGAVDKWEGMDGKFDGAQDGGLEDFKGGGWAWMSWCKLDAFGRLRQGGTRRA